MPNAFQLKPWQRTVILFVLAAISCAGMIYVYDSAFQPVIAKGTGPGGAPVPSGAGWLTLGLSVLGSLGFTPAAIWSLIRQFVNAKLPDSVKIPDTPVLPVVPDNKTDPSNGNPDDLIGDASELMRSFMELSANRQSRAAQRRFAFALIDVAPDLIKGVETSHEGGVIVIKYTGFVDAKAGV